jgi:ribose transport system substrate-binding protein
MKKIMVVLLCIVFAFAMIGCGNQTAATESAAASESAAPAASAAQETEPAASAASTEPAASASASETTMAFNPDTETDSIPYSELEAKYGPVPALQGDVTIGSILKNNANEFWLLLGDGMKKAGDKFGAKIDIQATRTETDTAGQLSIAETMLQNDYSALVLSPLTNDNLDSAVKTAVANGIPIVNCNCEYIADCDTFVGGLQIEIGRKAADYIAEKIGEKGKVAIIEGVPGTFTSIQRVAGFQENIAKYSDIQVVASQPANYEVEEGMNVAANIITQNPDIAAIYCCNDNMALGAVEALRSANLLGKVIVIGVDGTGDAYKSIKAGELTATVDQFAEDSGYAAVEVALRILGGQDIPKVVSTPIEVVDKEKAAEMGK